MKKIHHIIAKQLLWQWLLLGTIINARARATGSNLAAERKNAILSRSERCKCNAGFVSHCSQLIINSKS